MKKDKTVTEVTPTEVSAEDTEVQKPEGLTLRDAIEVAVIADRGDKADGSILPVRDENAEGATSDKSSAKSSISEPALEPPAEYNAEEKSDFLQLSRRGQEAQLRLDRSRKTKIEEIKAATNELNLKRKDYDEIESLAKSLQPYLAATGIKHPAEVALKRAVAMWKEFEEGDPNTAAAAYLQAKGRPVPKELLSNGGQGSQPFIEDPRITTLQNQQNALLSKIAEAERQQKGQYLHQAWSAFAEEKNANGQTKYPDLTNDESGQQLAINIGSLVRGGTPLSEQFIATVKARIPELTYNRLLEEAYRFQGGRVADSDTSRSQDTQIHIAKSRRAASFAPGSAASANGHSKYAPGTAKTTREAYERAVADYKSE